MPSSKVVTILDMNFPLQPGSSGITNEWSEGAQSLLQPSINGPFSDASVRTENVLKQ
jgi:hypothetical protein